MFGFGLRFALCVSSVHLSQVAKPIEKKPDRKSLQTVETVGLDFTTAGAGGDLAADLTRLQAEAEESYYGPAGSPVPGVAPPVEARTLAENAERLSRKRGDATPTLDPDMLSKLIAEKAEEFFKTKFGEQASGSSSVPDRKTFVQIAQEEKRADKEKRRKRQHKGRKGKKAKRAVSEDSEDDDDMSCSGSTSSSNDSVFREATREHSDVGGGP